LVSSSEFRELVSGIPIPETPYFYLINDVEAIIT
jgi:hypothetical protein